MHADPIQLELFTNRLRAIAWEMGELMRRTAMSTNVKERLDFSCGVLDARGELVVNAPHIPVHLGALGLCVQQVQAALDLQPGDVAITNHPAYGGSHLPDVTIVTPVHCQGELIGFVATRAHHAEIGGATPGSMPPSATALDEEGVIIAPRLLVRQGKAQWDEIRSILTGGRYPTRLIEENLADLAAAVAANHRGTEALRALAEQDGITALTGAMSALKARAERRMREALRRRGDGVYEAEERLDDGSPLRVRIKVSDGDAIIDFAGTAPIHPGNLNATPAIVRSVVIYVLRLLVDEPLPLNEGLLAPVTLRIPMGSMLNPDFEASPPPAVVGGNVETSQRLVDTLIKALGLMACGQGTMNNTLFGNERFGYYETLCGGAGAGPGFGGADAVHTHMTNTRITDPEVLEHRYPVRVERFAIRTGSGGAGQFRGGDGAVRELRFLEPVQVSLLTQHRVERPFGMEGGEPGQIGRQRIVKSDGSVCSLSPSASIELQVNDRLIVETPGGGGYGLSKT
ncbi:hydantoinase B/oxoprolinase family protein [bacterium]|nr:hydantoinase B/oxoprolinase family protein [bacterium]